MKYTGTLSCRYWLALITRSLTLGVNIHLFNFPPEYSYMTIVNFTQNKYGHGIFIWQLLSLILVYAKLIQISIECKVYSFHILGLKQKSAIHRGSIACLVSGFRRSEALPCPQMCATPSKQLQGLSGDFLLTYCLNLKVEHGIALNSKIFHL